MKKNRMVFFLFAAFLLWFGIMSFAGMLSVSCVPMRGCNRRISAKKLVCAACAAKKQDMATILFISKRVVRALSAFTNPRMAK